MAAKTLADIEQHARELAGGEFVIAAGTEVVEVHCGVSFAHFNESGIVFMRATWIVCHTLTEYARFVSLCSELDAWIKGDTE